MSLTLNHHFLDGKRRTVAAMLVFLDINDCELARADDDIAAMDGGAGATRPGHDAFRRRWGEDPASRQGNVTSTVTPFWSAMSVCVVASCAPGFARSRACHS